MENQLTNRREFLKTMGLVSVGFSLMGSSTLIDTEIQNSSSINAWLQILENGKVRVLTGKLELGQGISTAICQVAAEELNMAMDNVEIHLAETSITPNEGYTAGSRSIESSAMSVRYAAASAREILLKMASTELGIGVASLSIEKAEIKGGNKNITLHALLEGRQIEGKLNRSVPVRAKTVRKIVGHPVHRKAIDEMVRARHEYVQDLRFPEMVHARMVRPPSYSSKLLSFSDAGLKSLPGFLKTVKLGSFLGVIAEGEFQAIQLSEMAKAMANWSKEEKLPANTDLKEYLKSLPSDNSIDEEKGDAKAAIDKAALQHSASYFKPYIMHASNGPSCAVAIFKNGQLDVWCHSQGVYPLRETLASLLDL